MVKPSIKKQKNPKKPEIKKILKSKNKSKTPIINTSSSSDSDNESNSPEYIQKLIEPYTKDQLIDLIINTAITNPSLYNHINSKADSDVTHRKIFVYGLGWDTTKETLNLAFTPYGEIEDCNVVIDRVTGKAKGFGFVLFRFRKGALKALKEPKKRIGSRMTTCQLASIGGGSGGGGENGNANGNGSRKIYVSNVGAEVDAGRLRNFFERFGEIETGPLGFDSGTGKSRGFALFVYKSVEGFRRALEEPVKMFEGCKLHCQKAADGKNKGVVGTVNAPVVQQVATPQMMAAVAASQNFGVFGQGLNPMYGGFFVDPNTGLLAANPLYASGAFGQVGGVAGAPGGLGGYYSGAPGGLNIGVDSRSLLGGLGTTPLLVQGLGLQDAYPKKNLGPVSGSASGSASGSRSQGAGGSYNGYPSHMR